MGPGEAFWRGEGGKEEGGQDAHADHPAWAPPPALQPVEGGVWALPPRALAGAGGRWNCTRRK